MQDSDSRLNGNAIGTNLDDSSMKSGRRVLQPHYPNSSHDKHTEISLLSNKLARNTSGDCHKHQKQQIKINSSDRVAGSTDRNFRRHQKQEIHANGSHRDDRNVSKNCHSHQKKGIQMNNSHKPVKNTGKDYHKHQKQKIRMNDSNKEAGNAGRSFSGQQKPEIQMSFSDRSAGGTDINFRSHKKQEIHVTGLHEEGRTISKDCHTHQKKEIQMSDSHNSVTNTDKDCYEHQNQQVQTNDSNKAARTTDRNFCRHQKQENQMNGSSKVVKNMNKDSRKCKKEENQLTTPFVSTSQQKKTSVYNKTGAVDKESANSGKGILQVHELSSLMEKPSNEILLTLSIPHNNFLHLLENIKATDRALVAIVLNTVAKACKSSLRKNIASLLSDIFHCKNFAFCALPQYLIGFSDQAGEWGCKDSLQSLLDILICFSQFLPASASDILTVVLPLLKSASVKAFAKGEQALRSLLEAIHMLEEEKTLFINVHSRENVLKASRDEQLNLQQPHNNFREISIFPTREDILECKPFLRPNISVGSYIDVEHYLDVQFRLLREDYVRPFREGIFSYMNLPKAEKLTNKINKIKDVRIYHNVKIVKQEYLNNTVVHLAQFDAHRFKHIKWEYSKRFLTGSLLCFSCNNFQTLFFATVAVRDCNELSHGILILKFENFSDSVLNIDPNIHFVVVESSAYFEAYRHNLSALCKMSDTGFSMQKYIIHVQKNVETPLYLGSASTYDMQPLLQQRDEHLLSAFSNISRVTLLDYNQWPSEKDLFLDRSQYVALRAALTREFAIIQGPPGTGKTYIGLQIVKLLLHNVSTEMVGPILVLCYTNHALDQFLEGILQFNKNIVRVGGRCEHEKLRPYMMKNVKLRLKQRKAFPSYIYHSWNEQNDYLNQLRNDIHNIDGILHNCSHSVLNENDLRYYMGEEPYHALVSFTQHPTIQNVLMQYWLGVLSPNMSEEQKSVRGGGKGLSALHANEAFYEEEEDIQFDEGLRQVEGDIYDESEFFSSVPIYDSDSENDEMDFFQASSEKERKRYIKKMLASTDVMSVREVRKVRNIWYLDLNDRWRLYKHWVKQLEEEQRQELRYLQDLLQYENEKLSELKQEEDLFVLHQSEVVGMTTTGAAKYHNLIKGIKPQIVVIEEAAEILESHVVTSLTADTKHLILIGDHKQLRPKVNVYQLETKFNLSVSLFERMVNNNVEYYQLSMQHRMRPCIASLLVPHIYSVLENHESVSNFENIRGVCKNMFFLNHVVYEENEQDSQSHSNYHEAEFVVELCIYLLQQGYDKSQITILTTYSGQLFAIKKVMKNRVCSGVRVAVVDNFQGEENDIILMSFVRSNDVGKIGFIKMPNRTCVALSRARKGFFCIGNFQLFAEKSDLWKKITLTLAKENSIGPSLRLQCLNHPDTYTDVSKGSDFASVPEGGCNLPCEYRLNCGHTCTSKCHPYDLYHEEYLCQKPCVRVICENSHPCPKKCYQKCNLCQVSMVKTFSECEHEVSLACHIFSSVSQCPAPCSKTLQCGHLCKQKCFETCDVPCMEWVTVKLSCSHEIEINCSESTMKEEELLKKCNYPCSSNLVCGHTCKGTCSKCSEGKHQVCRENCTKSLQCGHQCQRLCYQICNAIQCKKNISLELSCGHEMKIQCFESRKKEELLKKCSYPCLAKLACGHTCKGTCSKCSQGKSHQNCHRYCKKLLQCGHRCQGLCFQTCTDILCKKTISVKLSCEHEIKIQCFESTKNEEELLKMCDHPCLTKLACGHNCKGTCSKCSQGKSHQNCHRYCKKLLQCGHRCQGRCFETCSDILCMEKTVVKLQCGHETEMNCFEYTNKEQFSKSCNYPCAAQLDCGHACKGTCSKCSQGRLHKICEERCIRRLICGHQCEAPCAKSCPPCNCRTNSEYICGHSSSISNSDTASSACFQPCLRSCKHQKCTNLCSDLCSYEHCTEPCSEVLCCGHECLGICSEPCPYCIICMPGQVENAPIDSGSKVNYKRRFLKLQECNHIFEVEELESWVKTCEESEGIQIIHCPKCEVVIRNNSYFMNSIKRTSMKIEKIKRDIFDAVMYMLNEDVKRSFVTFLSLEKLLYPKLFSEMMLPLFQVLNKNKNMLCSTLVRCLNLIIMSNTIFHMEEIYEDIALDSTLKSVLNTDQVKILFKFTDNTRNFLIAFFNTEYLTASEVQMKQIAREVLRYELLLWVLHFIFISSTDSQRSIFEGKYLEIVENLCKYGQFRPRNEAAVKEIFKSLGLDVPHIIDSKTITLLEVNFSVNSFTTMDAPLKTRLNTQVNRLQSGISENLC